MVGSLIRLGEQLGRTNRCSEDEGELDRISVDERIQISSSLAQSKFSSSSPLVFGSTGRASIPTPELYDHCLYDTQCWILMVASGSCFIQHNVGWLGSGSEVRLKRLSLDSSSAPTLQNLVKLPGEIDADKLAWDQMSRKMVRSPDEESFFAITLLQTKELNIGDIYREGEMKTN